MRFIIILIIVFFSNINFSQSFDWVKSISCNEKVSVIDILKISPTSFLVTGNFEGSLNIDNHIVSSLGGKDFFISKHDINGNLIWIKSFGGFEDAEINDIAINTDKDIFICGTFEGNVLIDSIQLINNLDNNAFIARLDSNCTVKWIKNIESESDVEANVLEFDVLKDKLFFVASYEENVSFDSTLLTAFGDNSLLLSCFNSDGTYQWGKEISCQDEIKASSLKLDSINNIYITGSFEGNIFFQSNVILNSSNKDFFLFKTDTIGNFIWSKTIGSSEDVESSNLFVLDSTIFVIGKFSGTANFQSNNLTSFGEDDGFILSLSTNNFENWVTTIASEEDVSPNDIFVDSTGNIFITGNISSSTNFEDILITNNSQDDLFICNYDFNGNVKWAKGFGGTSSVSGIAFTPINENKILISGVYKESAFFDSITVSSLNDEDVFFGIIDIETFNVNIQKNKHQINLTVYPNPTLGNVSILYDVSEKISYQIFDLTGKYHGGGTLETKKKQLDLSNLIPGIYILNLNHKRLRIIKK